jgi:hypothetical protein
MKRFLFLLASLSFSTISLSACTLQQSINSSVNSRDSDVGAIEEKSGESEMSGRVVVSGNKVYLMKTNGEQVEIDSYSLDLKSRQGEMITVTGQYSGETLFVGKIIE